MQYSSDESPAWSTNCWEPSAPESYVLLHGVDRPDAQPFKLAITELVARGALKLLEIEEPGVFGMRRKISVLTEGDDRKLITEQSLAAVQRVLGEARLSTFSDGTVGTTVEDLAVAAQRHYKPLSAYATDEVLPTLIDRGYYAKETRRILGIFPSTRYVLTPSGQAARADLQQRMDVGQADFHGWARNEPNNALLYMGVMGSSFLLMPMLFADVENLSGLPPGGFDVSGFDLGALNVSAFDGLDAALGAIDAGVDSGVGGGDGGGWGGGDGGGFGGGDGGGGGGGGD
jgi:uncharacterized membrane protein YgcG